MRLHSRPSDPAKANSSPARRRRTRGQKVLLAILIIAALGLAGVNIAFILLSRSGSNIFHHIRHMAWTVTPPYTIFIVAMYILGMGHASESPETDT